MGSQPLRIMQALLAQEEGEVVGEGADAAGVTADAFGPPETGVIQARNRPAQAMQPFGRMRVALAVLPEAMGNHHAAFRVGMLPACEGQPQGSMPL